MDYTIDEMETLRTVNEEKLTEIQCINNQLNKAFEVNKRISFYFYFFFHSRNFRLSNEQLI